MSSFLSAAENVARQRQNVRHDLKKMEKESRAVELALENHTITENHTLFMFGLCCTGKCFNYSKTCFWYHCDAVDAR